MTWIPLSMHFTCWRQNSKENAPSNKTKLNTVPAMKSSIVTNSKMKAESLHSEQISFYFTSNRLRRCFEPKTDCRSGTCSKGLPVWCSYSERLSVLLSGSGSTIAYLAINAPKWTSRKTLNQLIDLLQTCHLCHLVIGDRDSLLKTADQCHLNFTVWFYRCWSWTFYSSQFVVLGLCYALWVFLVYE